MAQYMIQMSHEPGECRQFLNQCSQQAQQFLQTAQFGCASGVHCAWAQVEADSEQQARQMLPQDQQANAQIVQVRQYTPQQIQQMHQAA